MKKAKIEEVYVLFGEYLENQTGKGPCGSADQLRLLE